MHVAPFGHVIVQSAVHSNVQLPPPQVQSSGHFFTDGGGDPELDEAEPEDEVVEPDEDATPELELTWPELFPPSPPL